MKKKTQQQSFNHSQKEKKRVQKENTNLKKMRKKEKKTRWMTSTKKEKCRKGKTFIETNRSERRQTSQVSPEGAVYVLVSFNG